MKILFVLLILLAGVGFWFYNSKPESISEQHEKPPEASVERSTTESLISGEAAEDSEEEGTALTDTPVIFENTEENLDQMKARILSEDDSPEIRAGLITQYFDQNADKQEVFEVTNEILQKGDHPKVFEKALYTQAAFLNRGEQQNLYQELLKKYSDPKIRKVIEGFGEKNQF